MLDKLKQLSKDTAIYGISTMVGRFLSFLLVPLYTHVFATDTNGIIANIYVLSAIANIVLLYGMDAAYLKFAGTPGELDEKDKFSTPFLLVFITSFFIAAILFIFRKAVFEAIQVPVEYSYLMIWIAPIIFFDTVSSIPAIKLRIENKAKRFAAIKVTNIVFTVIVNVVLIVFLHWDFNVVFICNAAASMLSFILLIPTSLEKLKFKIEWKLVRRLLKFGLPYLPAGLAANMVQGIDRPIMTHLTSLHVSGIYQANYKLGIFMMLYVSMFVFAWQPFFLSNQNEKNAKEIFSKVLTYFTIIGGIILVFLSSFIDIIARFLFAKTYLSGVDIVPVVLLGYLFYGMYANFLTGAFIKEKSYYMALMTGIGAIINVAVNFALIPLMGMMGAAIATLASYFVMAVGFFIINQRIYKTNYEYKKLIRLFILIFISGFIYYALYYSHHLSILLRVLNLLLFTAGLIIFVLEENEKQFIKRKFLAWKK